MHYIIYIYIYLYTITTAYVYLLLYRFILQSYFIQYNIIVSTDLPHSFTSLDFSRMISVGRCVAWLHHNPVTVAYLTTDCWKIIFGVCLTCFDFHCKFWISVVSKSEAGRMLELDSWWFTSNVLTNMFLSQCWLHASSTIQIACCSTSMNMHIIVALATTWSCCGRLNPRHISRINLSKVAVYGLT